MSRICGACNKPCGTAHDCISCGKPVHSTVLCESVWMPGEESEEEGEGSDKPDPVAWSMPDGFTLGAEPSKLDASLVGKHIYMRWKDYGWQLGKVYEQITNANPRLFKKFNYRVVWADTANQGPDEPARGGELRARLGRGSRLVGGAGAQGGRRWRSGVGVVGSGPVRRGVS